MESAIESAQRREHQGTLTDIFPCGVENVARQQMLELFLAASDATEEQNHTGRGHDESDSDDRFLWHRTLRGAPRPTKECRPNERHTQRNPECDSIIEVIAHEQSHARAERRYLRERQVNEDYFP